MAGTIQWFDPEAFACVASPTSDSCSLAGRALERRRITAQNRRLVWELQTINEIASGVSRSLELTDILTRPPGLVRAMDGAAASIRLYDRVSDRFEERAAVGAEAMQQLWTTHLPGLPGRATWSSPTVPR